MSMTLLTRQSTRSTTVRRSRPPSVPCNRVLPLRCVLQPPGAGRTTSSVLTCQSVPYALCGPAKDRLDAQWDSLAAKSSWRDAHTYSQAELISPCQCFPAFQQQSLIQVHAARAVNCMRAAEVFDMSMPALQ